MNALFPSLLLATRDLADRAVLRVLGKCVAISLALFAVLGFAGWWGLDWLLQRAGLKEATFMGADAIRTLASGVAALLGLWLAWRAVGIAVVQFFADDVVLAVEQRHYPSAAASARDLPVPAQLRAALASGGRALLFNLLAVPFALALLFTAIGPAVVFVVVNAVLLGRELVQMVALRHPGQHREIARADRWALGALVTGLLALPLAGLVAPVLGAAAATHLFHRRED